MKVMKKLSIGFTGNQLKIFALICMTLDHMGIVLFPEYPILRYIGRLSMPIFAWMIAEGCRYTKNKALHLITMVSVALGCQVVYWVVERSLMQCILVTFSLSVILIYSLDFAIQKNGFISKILPISVFLLIAYLCLLLPKQIDGFSIDYGFFGVLLPVIVYLGRTKGEKLFGASCCMAGIAIGASIMQWFSFVSLPALFLYNGKKGKARLKYLFYIYYPLHLAILYVIAYFINTY